MEKLNKKELKVQGDYLKKLKIKKRKTKTSVVVAMVGLVCSGKSNTAKEIGKHIGGTVVVGDDIRILLRKQKQNYNNVRQIVENVSKEVLEKGGSIVLDSDFVASDKRKILKDLVKKIGVKVVFIRTFADRDIMIGWAVNLKKDEFFGSAGSEWKGKNKTAVVKIREMWRRAPYHYKWEDKGIGRWVLKKLPFKLFAEINTGDSGKWKKEVEKISKKLLQLF